MKRAHEPSVTVGMKSSLVLEIPELARAPAAFRTALNLIDRGWRYGTVAFVLPTGREIVISGADPGPNARLIVRDYRFMNRVMAAGDIGFAEGYMAGEWDTPDLSVLLEAMSRNFDGIQRVALGSPLAWLVNLAGHLMNDNSRKGSKRNIHAHYDLGNAFYSRWLDPSMTYSSARYERPGQALTDAQRNKYQALARSMDLRPEHHVLEIGCGWGGFAEFAAKDMGARVTGITISKEQYDFATKRLFDQGLNERAQIKLIDYRDVDGQFDRVASIEMFEAVGERHWPAYFAKVRDVLSPSGRAGLQIITIRDEFFSTYAVAPTSSRNTSSQAACCPPSAASRRKPNGPACRGAGSAGSARTMPTRSPNGAVGSKAPGTTSAAWGSMSVSGAFGGSICPIAKPDSAQKGPMWWQLSLSRG